MENKDMPVETILTAAAASDVLSRTPRVAEIRLPQQTELEATLNAAPIIALARRQQESGAADLNDLSRWQLGSLVLPVKGDHPVRAAVEQVRRRLRLRHNLVPYLNTGAQKGVRLLNGIREGDTIHIFLDPALAEDTDASRLAYHLGRAVWMALDTESTATLAAAWQYPIDFETRQHLLAYTRCLHYSSTFYGLLACGDLATATEETWRQCTGRRGPLNTAALLDLSRHYAETGYPDYRFNQARDSRDGQFLVSLPEALHLFAQTERYRSLIDEPGGLDWDTFLARLAALDSQTYVDSDDWTGYLANLTNRLVVFGIAYIAGGDGAFDAAALRDFLVDNDLAPAEFEAFMESFGWTAGPDGNTAEQIQEVLAEPHRQHLLQCAGDPLRQLACAVFVFPRTEELTEQEAEAVFQSRVTRYSTIAREMGVTTDQAQAHLVVTKARLDEADEDSEG